MLLFSHLKLLCLSQTLLLNLILVGSLKVDSVATTPWNVPTFCPVAEVILSSIVKEPLIAFVSEDQSGSEFKFKILMPVSANLLI